jgi:lauroyl/myristoyl acyltransferase
MQFLVFIIAYPFLWFISILPFRIFYFLSDLVYYILYYIIGYRKKTVRANLILAFPDLTPKERFVIEKKHYKHLSDTFLEIIKTMSISEAEMNKRFVITNIELVREYEAKNKSIALLASHYASWEWLLTMNTKVKYKGIGIYKKISNRYFDKMIRDIRSKFNAELVEVHKSKSTMAENYKKGILSIYGLASDQSPMLHKAEYWQSFMGVEVPVHVGAETVARAYDMNVLFVKVKKIKRGFYEATFVPISDDVLNTPKFEITNTYIKEVEKQIQEAPEFYFWTHNRWKHRRE